MKKIKSTILALTLVLSAILPAKAFAANAVISDLTASNNSTSMHVEGTTSALAVAIEVMDEAGTTSIAGPETTSVVSGAFAYDLAGTFDTSVVYTIRVADYDAGTWYTVQTTAVEPVPDTTPSDEGQGGATSPDTGVAPKTSETADRATTNISLGVAIVVASALTYGVYLLNKRIAK